MASDFAMSKLMQAAGKAFLISLVLTPIVRDIFRAYNVVDRPGRRKVHAYPIPRVGGLPIVCGYVLALLSLTGSSAPDPAMPGDWVWKLLPGMAIIFFTGLIDDFFNLQPKVKLLGEIAAAAAVYAAGLRIQGVGDYPLPEWLSLPLTIFWLLLATNAQNLIDGLDGLCTGMGFFATVTFVCVGLIQKNPALVSLALPLAGALLGFLFYNFNPATVFLGDSGALTLGFLLGCYGLVWTEKGTGLLGTLVPLLAMVIPMMDLSLSIVRRSLKGQAIFSADKGHIHHKLLERGLSVRRSALTLYGIALVATGFAVLIGYPGARGFHGLVVLGFCIAAGAGIHQLRYPEFKVAHMFIFRGGLRRAFQRNLRLEELTVSLDRARDEDEWWSALVEMARKELWIRLRWTGHHPALEAVLSERKPDWSFQLALGENEAIQVEGAGIGTDEEKRPALDLIGFSAVLRSTLAAKRRQPALLRAP
jgi:UDP-GlcNAc:undecaprenyl-phosphate GlcNAc-1-phosphate transferase